jgi:hypothetical protein
MRPEEIVVGMLYLGPDRNGLPVWSQPGGIGTLVYPQLPNAFPWFGGPAGGDGIYSWPASYPAQYFWPCGHPANTAEIYSFADIYNDNEVMAAIVCPLCSYVIQLMPLAQYQNNQTTPLVIG